ncbi:hypothetical protein NF212_08980 [Parasalinivibrio latis]|uniref:hypothetical protein n=1 Tax=Parasalinivibrio latis TaxID=2952610 RepID=UPI0030E01073
MERSAAELGPVIPLFALALAVISLLQATWPPPERKDMAVIFVLSLLFIVPSQQLTNVIIFFLAVWLLYRNSNQSFWGASILVMVSLQGILAVYLLKWAAGPVLTFDAALTSVLLNITTGSASYLGNIVYGPADHQLLILRGCSSLPLAMGGVIAWFAIARFSRLPFNAREIAVVCVISFLLISLNIIRLSMMACDMNWHTWWHATEGQQTFQLLAVFIILASCAGGLRYVRS